MIDTIIGLWNASPVSPLAVAIVGWVVWKLYSAIGLKAFCVVVAILVGLAIFWDAERLQQILTWLCGAYVVLRLFGVIEGGVGSSVFRHRSAPDDGPRIPQGAPAGFNPYIQAPGTHPTGYDPDHDPDTKRWDGI